MVRVKYVGCLRLPGTVEQGNEISQMPFEARGTGLCRKPPLMGSALAL